MLPKSLLLKLTNPPDRPDDGEVSEDPDVVRAKRRDRTARPREPETSVTQSHDARAR